MVMEVENKTVWYNTVIYEEWKKVECWQNDRQREKPRKKWIGYVQEDMNMNKYSLHLEVLKIDVSRWIELKESEWMFCEIPCANLIYRYNELSM